MSTLGLIATVGAATLLVVLTIVTTLNVRQIGLVTALLERARDGTAPVRDGLDLGSAVPSEVAELLPAVGSGASVFALVLGGSCQPCRELLADLREQEMPHPTVALIGSDGETALAMAELLPSGVSVHSGNTALAAISALRTETTPSVFVIAGGSITGKAALRGADHLLAVMRDPAGVPVLAITEAG